MINYMDKFKLVNRVAVVAGGLGLIGKETSVALAQAGAKVIILDIDEKKGQNFESECLDKKLNVKFIKFDITNLNEIDKNISELFYQEGPINIWVNSAYPRTKEWGVNLKDIKVEIWQKNVDMHLNSYCLITKTIAELMVKEKIKGNIINLGSIYGVVGPDFEVYSNTQMNNEGTYAAIKGGIINFSRFAASFYGKYGIRINSLCPGGVFDNQDHIFVENYGKRTPLKRMARADEISSAILFLASEASSYITGSTFMVDGGWTCI